MEIGKWTTACEAGACVWAMELPNNLGYAVKASDQGSQLFFTKEEWEQFTEGVKAGAFD